MDFESVVVMAIALSLMENQTAVLRASAFRDKIKAVTHVVIQGYNFIRPLEAIPHRLY